jgi:hypothetical protein
MQVFAAISSVNTVANNLHRASALVAPTAPLVTDAGT